MLYYLRLNYREISAFRLSFIFKIIQRIFSSLLFLVLWLVIVDFDLDDTINTWTFSELMLLIGFFELNFAMFMIFGVGFFTLPYLVPSGRLDDMLILPISTTRALIGENLSPDRLVRVFAAIIILTVAIFMVKTSFPLVLFGLIIAFAGSLLENIFMMTLNLLSFWLGNMGAVVECITELDNAKQFPLNKVSSPFKVIVTFAIPVIFVSTFPVSILTSRIDANEIIFGSIVLVILLFLWMFLFKTLWSYGLKNYQSGGSL